MAGCKLLNSIKRDCVYKIGGLKRLFLINYDLSNQYVFDSDGVITTITPASGEKIYQIDFSDNSASWTDDLILVSRSQKYRTSTINFQISDLNKDVLNEGDALSLGTFTAFVVDRNDTIICLGRENGLQATSFNYNSGAAEGDAVSFTTILVGNEKELPKLVKNESVITSLVDNVVVLNE
ncbi:hypothetical protein EZS27_008664 [termite gut metagenome]|uniref:Uncharacterized protein n=1 Tax=termite gut metagenome TaxID=433724 RepID=A0A5J4SBX8_9ZZZZ